MGSCCLLSPRRFAVNSIGEFLLGTEALRGRRLIESVRHRLIKVNPRKDKKPKSGAISISLDQE